MRLVALKHLLKKWPAKPKALNVQVLFWTMCDHNMLLCMFYFVKAQGNGLESKNRSYMHVNVQKRQCTCMDMAMVRNPYHVKCLVM